MNDITTGADFGRATASWFGLDADKVSADMKLAHGQNDVLSVTLTIMLGPDDIAGIGKRMKEIAAGSNGIVSVEERDVYGSPVPLRKTACKAFLDEYPGWEFVLGDGVGWMKDDEVVRHYMRRQSDETIPPEMTGRQFIHMLKSFKDIRRCE